MIDQYLDEGEIQGVGYVFVVDSDDEVISHTFVPGIPSEVRALKGDKHGTTVQRVEIAGLGDFIDIATPVLASEIGVAHVGMDRAFIQRSIKAATIRQSILLVLIFAATTVAAVPQFRASRLSEMAARMKDLRDVPTSNG